MDQTDHRLAGFRIAVRNGLRIAGWGALLCSVAGHSLLADTPDFNRDIRPILSDRCFRCHGPDAASNHSGLRLDLGESALDELPGGEGRAFVPGSPELSVALQRILESDDSVRMPPADSQLSVSEEEIGTIRRWIEGGAKYEGHWAFQPLDAAASPPAESGGSGSAAVPWARGEIDRFVQEEHRKRALQPNPESEPWRWLRRVTLDLTGLPPEPAEVLAFEADHSEPAREAVVDRLLASPHFGEHFAVPWMDAARYADSYGYQSDLLSPTWPWRDWVVESLNENLSYDRFLTHQLAGDLLPGADRKTRLATAFNRLHRQTNEGGSVPEEWRQEYVADRVNTFGSAMLGLTLECARCHDHKFDPLTQREYYAFSAFFCGIDEWGTYDASDRVPTPSLALPTDEQSAAIVAAEEEVESIRRRLADFDRQLSGEPFQAWLDSRPGPVSAPLATAHWPLDELADGTTLANLLDAAKPAKTAGDNRIVAGRLGQALEFSGDAGAEFTGVGGHLEPWQRFSVEFWARFPTGLAECVILHRQSGTDAGHFGTELRLVDSRLRFSMIRFWPGQALSVETRLPVPPEEWVHIVISHDGSGTAGGMRVFVNGENGTRRIRDELYKAPGAGGNDGFVMGERFRSVGLKGGIVDNVRFYPRPLTELEVQSLARDGESVDWMTASRNQQAGHFLAVSTDRQAIETGLSAAVQKMFAARAPVLETMVMKKSLDPVPAWVLARGDYDAPRPDSARVDPGVPACLSPFPADAPRDRLGLAQWMTAKDHPLAARVAVNRIWKNFFGEGLVSSVGDFGGQGNYPSHPALLDWLAVDFVHHGWDLKRLCRQIVLSATYRQSAVVPVSGRQEDPGNRWLARGPSSRLTAEMVRDLALSASGLLVRKLGGPPVSPYQPGDLWRENNTMTNAWQQSSGEGLYRRSLYSVWKRTAPLANMTAFDATSREVCTISRGRTSTPLQALVLLNDVQFVEAARRTAERAGRMGSTPTEQLQSAFLLLAGRRPDEAELKLLLQLLEEQLQIFEADPESAARLLAVGETAVDETGGKPDPVALAAMTVAVQAILNSDAVIWKR